MSLSGTDARGKTSWKTIMYKRDGVKNTGGRVRQRTCSSKYTRTSREGDTSEGVQGRPRHTTWTIFPILLVGTIRPVGASTSWRRPSEQHREMRRFEFSFSSGDRGGGVSAARERERVD